MCTSPNPLKNREAVPDELFEAAIVAEKHIRTSRFRKAVRYIVADAMEREGANIKLLWRQAMKIFDPTEHDPREGDRKPLHFDDAADIAIAFVESGLGLDDGEAIAASVIHKFSLSLDEEGSANA